MSRRKAKEGTGAGGYVLILGLIGTLIYLEPGFFQVILQMIIKAIQG